MLRLDMRVVFMGSPEFAIPCLQAISSHHELIAVVTQPDRPAGRGRKLHPSAVKVVSQDLDIPVFQPKKIRELSFVETLNDLAPDLIIVVAYGQILSQEILDIPKYGSINVHASLLPQWRGAAPIQAAILNGDSVTGITIMLMDAGMDTGPILSQVETVIQSHETGGVLAARLSKLGSELLIDTIPRYIDGELLPTDQVADKGTYAPMIRKSDGILDFNKSADALSRQVRAYEPWPTSYFQWNDRRIVVRQCHSQPRDRGQTALTIELNGLPAIVTGEGILVLDQVQPAGKKIMDGEAFLRGSPSFIGSMLS